MGADHKVTLVAANEAARKRYSGDWDDSNDEPVDDWGFSESERCAFVAGALFEAERRDAPFELPVTVEQIEQVASLAEQLGVKADGGGFAETLAKLATGGVLGLAPLRDRHYDFGGSPQ